MVQFVCYDTNPSREQMCADTKIRNREKQAAAVLSLVANPRQLSNSPVESLS